MKSLLSRTSLLAALVLLPGCATLAQDPEPYRNVNYSGEELDNLVAPVALYPDALLAQILVAATFPDQLNVAQRYVRERGTRNIDDQGWDISVKAVAYYPPILNMLANDDDWTVALGQAYASQSGDVMDAVQRLREMAREQGNLVSTREHVVSEDRGRIVIVPANPQVIYVPTYDPAIVYVRPIWSFGFHTGYFSFGIGFPIGSWLVYDVDWWGHRVYYDGWYGDGWRYNARRYFVIAPIYHRPRYSVVNININIFNRRPNYINLDRRYRYVRRNVEWERHDRGGSYSDRYRGDDRRASGGDDRRGTYDGSRRDGDGRNGDDRRGPVGVDGRDGRSGRDNDRIGERASTFDDYRPDRGGRTGTDARDSDPPVDRSGFGVIEKGRNGETRSNGNSRADNGSRSNGNAPDYRGSRPEVPVYTSVPRAERSSKANGNGGGRTQSSDVRGSSRPNAPVFSAPPRQVERKSNGGGNRSSGAEYRSAPRSSEPTFSAPQRSVERKSSGGGGGSVQSSRPTTRSAPSVSRQSGGGGGGRVKQSGGGGGGNSNRGGGGKGRKQ